MLLWAAAAALLFLRLRGRLKNKTLKGDRLIPLNSLKEFHPNLYNEYSKKYFDRPERKKLLTRQIPKLNCLWNDVLHFLPLHPYYVYEALTSLGIKTKQDQLFFKIPIEKLKNNKNAYYLYTKEKYRGPVEDIEEDEIKLLEIEDYKELKAIPRETLNITKFKKIEVTDLVCSLSFHIYLVLVTLR